MSKFVLGIFALISLNVIVNAESISKPKGDVFTSSGFSCKVNPGGMVGNIKYKGKLLFKSTILFGRYLTDSKGVDNRFFQRYRKSDPNMTVETVDNKTVVTTKGELANKTFAPGAEYTEKVTLSADMIRFEYELKTAVEFKALANVFRTSLQAPCDTFNNRGAKSTKMNGRQKLAVFPESYQKGSRSEIGGKSVIIVFDDFKLELSGAMPDSVISLEDTRGYGDSKYLFNITQHKGWRSKAWVYPAGTTFKWAFTLKALPR